MRVLFAWELGGGLGHLDRLAPWARVLAAGGAEVYAAVRDLPAGALRLAVPERALLQAPVLLHGPLHRDFAPRAYAELLLMAGYGNPETLGALLRGWLSMFAAVRPEVVVADHAPTALLAGRVASLPVVHLGDGFTIALPDAEAGAGFDPEARRRAEALALRSINRALADFAVPALPDLRALGDAALTLLATYPELDHRAPVARNIEYVGHFGPDDGAEGAGAPPLVSPAAPRRRILAYLKPAAANFEAAVRVLAKAKAGVRVYAGGLTSAPGAEHLDWQARPVPIRAALAECDLVVCHGGHGTTCEALLAGRPVLALPSSYEQLLTARNLAKLGAGAWVHPEADMRRLSRTLSHCLNDAEMAAQARAFSRRYRRGAAETTARLAEGAGRIRALAQRGEAA